MSQPSAQIVADEGVNPPPSRPDTARSNNGSLKTGGFVRRASQSFTQSRPPDGLDQDREEIAQHIATQTLKSSICIANERLQWQPPSKQETIIEKKEAEGDIEGGATTSPVKITEVKTPHDHSVPYENGYQFPPKHTAKQATLIGLRSFGKWVITPLGFIITIYSLNVVAWGAMLFFILIHATPAMAHPSYSDDYSGAKIWLEITAQILNALFCVTGLGLIPWRFRDLYYLIQWRWKKDHSALQRLAGIQRDWFRLQGSQEVDVNYHPATDPLPAGIDESVLAIPVSLSPDAPLTGERASQSKYWLLDFVIWMFVINTFLQIILCGFMWGYNRFHRPGAAVGLLISVSCIVGAAAGWVIFKEGKRVKNVEGVPVSAEDQELLRQMREKDKVAAMA